MSFRQVFDIIGPIMIGPSSSHTAGAARIGRAARQIFGEQPKCVTITLYGSFAKTYRGHGTDIALVGGILDFDTYDERIKQSLEIAKKMGVVIDIQTSDQPPPHPNTASLCLSNGKRTLEIVGTSIGGGAIEVLSINQFKVNMSASGPTLAILHVDTKGVIAQVTKKLAAFGYNIATMEVSRSAPGCQALMLIQVDQPLLVKPSELLKDVDEVIEAAYVNV